MPSYLAVLFGHQRVLCPRFWRVCSLQIGFCSQKTAREAGDPIIFMSSYTAFSESSGVLEMARYRFVNWNSSNWKCALMLRKWINNSVTLAFPAFLEGGRMIPLSKAPSLLYPAYTPLSLLFLLLPFCSLSSAKTTLVAPDTPVAVQPAVRALRNWPIAPPAVYSKTWPLALLAVWVRARFGCQGPFLNMALKQVWVWGLPCPVAHIRQERSLGLVVLRACGQQRAHAPCRNEDLPR